jgi:hypothetical protein
MAHFTELDASNLVLRVIVVDNTVLEDESGVEQEQKGIDFCKRLFGADTIWKQTSYNGSFRVRYAGIGFTFDESLDAFIPPKPYPSWVLDQNIADWVAPVIKPGLTPDQEAEGMTYIWNEDNQEWVLIQSP